MKSNSSNKRKTIPTNDVDDPQTNLKVSDPPSGQDSDSNNLDPTDPEYLNNPSGSDDDDGINNYQNGINNYQNDPYDYSSDGENDTLEALREKQIQAIKDMEFEEADKLQQRIAALADRQSDDIIVKHCSSLTARCNKIAKEYMKRRKAALKIQHQNEINVRRSMTEEFIEKQNKQVEALRVLENNLFEQFKVLMDRPIPKYEDMNKRAVQAGLRGDFKAASDLRDEAKEIQIKKLEKRKVKFEEIYKKQVNALLDKQRQELTELTVKLNQNIGLVEKQRKTMIENESANFRRKLLREYSLISNRVKVNSYDPKKAREMANSRSPSKQNSQASSVKSTDEEDLSTVPLEMKKVVLKELASTFDDILSKYGLTKGDDTKALSLSDMPSSKAPSVAPGTKRKPF